MGRAYSIYGHDIQAVQSERPTAAEIEDKDAAANLERDMSMSAATQMMVQPTAAQETLLAAGAMGVSESVVVDTQVMVQTPLPPFSRFI